MSLPARGFVVFLLSTQVAQGIDDWGVTYTSTKFCAVKGSTVEIRSTYTFPSTWKGSYNLIEKRFWFTKHDGWYPVDLTTDSEYAGRVEDLCENNICTLRIRNLRESDSAEYWFRFDTIQEDVSYIGIPGVTLSVTDPDLQLKVSRAYSGQAELKCQTSCHVPDNNSYIWYKNGEELRTGISYSRLVNFGSADIYSCALNGHENHRSPSVYAPKPPSVSVSPSAEIEEGSSVTLTCSSDANPAANYTWYKEDGLIYSSEEHQIVFSSINSSDSGEYFCTAENELGRRTSGNYFIDVKYAPKPPSVSVSPSAGIEEGSSVTLTCSSDANPAANHTWYKNETSYSSILNEEQQFVFSSIYSSDSGEYFCTAENKLGRRTSEKLFIDVKYKSQMIMNFTRLVLVVLVVLALSPLLLVFLWLRKKKASSSTTEANEPIETVELDPFSVYENILDLNMVSAEQTEEPEEQEDLV